MIAPDVVASMPRWALEVVDDWIDQTIEDRKLAAEAAQKAAEAKSGDQQTIRFE